MFNSRCAADDKRDIETVMKSTGILAIEIDVYLTNKSQKAVMCVINGVLILLYKKTGKMIMNPFKVDDVEVLIIADNVPSAASLKLDEEAIKQV